MVLLTGAVVGAQFGTKAGTRLRAEYLRGLLAAVVLAACARLGWDLVATPEDVYSIAGGLSEGGN